MEKIPTIMCPSIYEKKWHSIYLDFKSALMKAELLSLEQHSGSDFYHCVHDTVVEIMSHEFRQSQRLHQINKYVRGEKVWFGF